MTLKLPPALVERSVNSPFAYFIYDSNDDNFVVPFHYHENQQLFRVIQGSVNISINSVPHILKKNDCAILPSKCVHALYPLEKETKFESLSFDVRELFDLTQNHFKLIKQLITHQLEISIYYSDENEEDRIITSLVSKLIECYRSKGRASVILATAKILEILGTAAQMSTSRECNKEDINRYYKYYGKSTNIYKFICDNYQREVTLEELAGAVDLSEKYFCKFFKELTDLRPMEFVNMFRIEAAAIELVISSDSINEIATRCGFKDPCYFTKLFRRFKGTSPREFREEMPVKLG